MAYTAPDYIKAWTRAAFGVVIGFLFMYFFSSVFLGLLTAAFLFFLPNQDTNFERKVNRFIFGGLMAIILVLAFTGEELLGLGLDFGGVYPWEWNATAVIFMGIWIISFFSGLIGGIEAKHGIGVIMILISFFIFTFGVGSDSVGAAAFGDWWPQVKAWGDTVIGPLKTSFTSTFESLKKSWGIFSDPFGAAREIIDGVYKNPTGKGEVGSFGVEIEEFGLSDSKLFLGQPFSLNVGLKNQGAVKAESIELNIYVPKKDGRVDASVLGIKNLPFSDPDGLEQEDIRSENFVSTGITCSALSNFLKESLPVLGKGDARLDYIIPLRAEVRYDYSMESSLKIDVISKEERERLLKEGKLPRNDVKSEMTSSPISLSISLGSKQPIEENSRFFIGIEAKNRETNGEALNAQAVFTFPQEFEFDDSHIAYSGGDKPFFDSNNKNKINWPILDLKGDESKRLFIEFPKGVDINSAEKTFIIGGEVYYFKFLKWKDISKKIELGGFCCPGIDNMCIDGKKCTLRNDDIGICGGN